MAKAGVQVHNLVGVDPVSKLGRFWVDGSSAKNIVAVFGSAAPGGGPDASNFIENVGKILGSLTLSGTMPSVFSEANQTISLAVDHEDFKNLYEGANVPKKSAAQIVDDSYDDSCC